MARKSRSKALSKSKSRSQIQTHSPHRWPIGILLLILVLSGILRFIKLGEIPPGLHVDEAANAWNAYTVLKTGKDQHGVQWPVFSMRAFGDNRTTSYMYALLPFQAAGGFTVWTARFPAAIGGVVTVLLIYLLGTRLFDRWTGLIAAGLLAVNPWHVQISRYGHEAALVPPLIMVTLVALLWANMPLDDREQGQARPLRAALAGALAGISCYGYWAVRIFLPVFLPGAVLVAWRDWWDRLKTREGALAVGALLVAFAVTFGPLAWKHFTDPEISKRGQAVSWVWDESDALGEKIQKVLSRYLGHFGPDFLFVNGDGDPALSPPPGVGLFHWYELPLMLLGLMTCAMRFKTSRAARVLLLWIILYPAPDLLYSHVTLHSLRSLPGLTGFILLEAVGAVSAGRWLRQHQRGALTAICSGMAITLLILNVRFLHRFFGDFQRQKYNVLAFGADILEAARWIRPRFKDVDAVFVTGSAAHPYIIMLMGLGYDPNQWFRDVREIVPGPLPSGAYRNEDVYIRYGKVHFIFNESNLAAVDELLQNGRPDRVIFIVRPGELRFEKHTSPVYEIRNMDGQAVLWIFDFHL